MNQWVRDAFAYANEKTGREPTYQDIADVLNAARIGQAYDKSVVQKMTVGRKVSLLEAGAISQATGYPLPEAQFDAQTLDDRLESLSPQRQERLVAYLEELEALEAADQAHTAPQKSSAGAEG